MSIWSTLHLRFCGFAFSTNRWIFLYALTSALLFTVVDHLGIKIFFGLVLSITSGLVMIPLTECVASFPQKPKELERIMTEAYSIYISSLESRNVFRLGMNLQTVRNVVTTLERKVVMVVGAEALYRLFLLAKNTNLISTRLFRRVECQVSSFC